MQTAIQADHDAQRRECRTQGGTWIRCAIVAVAFVILGHGSGCITAPPKKQTLVEKAREENALGAELARQFDAKLKIKSDPVVDQYLNGLARMLAAPLADSRLTETGVVVIQDRAGLWRSYSLPGKKAYLPLGLLQKLRFDNEIGALIALEFGNLVQSHALDHLKSQTPAPRDGAPSPLAVPADVDFFSPQGLFAFDVDEMKNSIKAGVDILYKAGFDSRGMLQLWAVLQQNPSHSPFPDAVLEELSDFTRAVISRYAPLRNPIVGTQDFQTVHKRLLKL